MTTQTANRALDEALSRGPRCGRSHVIAIDGPTGGGKTTLAKAIGAAADSRGLGCRVIHTDEICPGWNGLREVPRIIQALLEQLALDTEAFYPTWDWHAGRPGDQARVAPTDIVVVEGVGSGALRCAPYLSARFFLDAPAEVRKERTLARDGDIFASYWDDWAHAEAQYFAEEWPQEAVRATPDN